MQKHALFKCALFKCASFICRDASHSNVLHSYVKTCLILRRASFKCKDVRHTYAETCLIQMSRSVSRHTRGATEHQKQHHTHCCGGQHAHNRERECCVCEQGEGVLCVCCPPQHNRECCQCCLLCSVLSLLCVSRCNRESNCPLQQREQQCVCCPLQQREQQNTTGRARRTA